MAQALEGTAVELGGQDCHVEAQGPFTGRRVGGDAGRRGAKWVVLGHSERRTAYEEDDALVVAKTRAAMRAGLTPIVCVGESLEERQAGRTLEVVARQTRESLPDEPARSRWPTSRCGRSARV
jgi:triosephosphate isomerase